LTKTRSRERLQKKKTERAAELLRATAGRGDPKKREPDFTGIYEEIRDVRLKNSVVRLRVIHCGFPSWSGPSSYDSIIDSWDRRQTGKVPRGVKQKK